MNRCFFDVIKDDDLPAIMKIEKVSFTVPWTLEQMRAEIHNEYGFSFVIKDQQGSVCGYAFATLICGELQIHNICITPQARNQGSGSQLIQYLLAKAREKQASKAFLEVRESNIAARHLYEKFGFRVDYTRASFYTDGEAAMVMSVLL